MLARIIDRRRVQIAVGATCSPRRPTSTVLLEFQANCGVCGIAVHGSHAPLEPRGGRGGRKNFEHLQRLPLLVLWQERWGRFFAERPSCLPLLSVFSAFRNLFRNRVNVNLPRTLYRRTRAMMARYLRFSTRWLGMLERRARVNYSFNLYHWRSRFYSALFSNPSFLMRSFYLRRVRS